MIIIIIIIIKIIMTMKIRICVAFNILLIYISRIIIYIM